MLIELLCQLGRDVARPLVKFGDGRSIFLCEQQELLTLLLLLSVNPVSVKQSLGHRNRPEKRNQVEGKTSHARRLKAVCQHVIC